MKQSAVFAALVSGLAAFVFTPDTAEARIVCKKGFQKVGGSLLSTPYCQDKYLAQVAREYGLKTSDSAIRNNPNYKRYVCSIIGHDIRVHIACAPVHSPRRRRF